MYVRCELQKTKFKDQFIFNKKYSSMTMGRDDYLFMIPIIQPNR